MARWVRNLSTGLVHDVPESHWSLADDGYEVVSAPAREPAPTPSPKAEPKAKPKARRSVRGRSASA